MHVYIDRGFYLATALLDIQIRTRASSPANIIVATTRARTMKPFILLLSMAEAKRLSVSLSRSVASTKPRSAARLVSLLSEHLVDKKRVR